MAFLRTVPPEEATGELKDLYEQDLKSQGYIANHTRALSLRPKAIAAWRTLARSIRAQMHPRRYELVTLSAAVTQKSTYCALAHGAVLRKNFFSAEELAAIVRNFRNAGLDPAEVAMMAFAGKVTRNAHSITARDIEGLRAHGLSDEEILDIALAAAARNFYSKALNAIGAEPDPVYLSLEEPLRRALTVGRPFGT